MYLNAAWDYFSWCHPKIIYGKKPCVRNLFTLDHYEEHVASSVIVWGTMLLCSNLFVLSFQGSLHLKRTAATLPFCSDLSTWLSVQWSRKRRPVQCPIWLACHSHCLDEGNKKEVMLVKTKQKSMCNKNYFRRQGWRLLRISAQVTSRYYTSTVLRAQMLCKVWSYWDSESTAGSSVCLHNTVRIS